MRSLVLVLTSTLFLFHALPSRTRAASDLSGAETGKVTSTGTRPAFVSPAHLGEFLLAVHDAANPPSPSRLAAETLSQKFSDDDRPSRTAAAPSSGSAAALEARETPYIFEAAYFEPGALHPIEARSFERVFNRRPGQAIPRSAATGVTVRATHVPRHLSPTAGEVSKPDLAWLYK